MPRVSIRSKPQELITRLPRARLDDIVVVKNSSVIKLKQSEPITGFRQVKIIDARYGEWALDTKIDGKSVDQWIYRIDNYNHTILFDEDIIMNLTTGI